MNLLEENRLIINEVDEQLVHLFEKRMHAVEGILQYKQENNLPVLDSSREAANIERGKGLLEDQKLSAYFEKWYQMTMDISKEYQKDLMKKK